MKNINNSADIIDLTLTVKNAKKRGYEYVDDVTYDVLAPNLPGFGILELIQEYGYKLGAPYNNDNDKYLGLYAPTEIVKKS